MLVILPRPVALLVSGGSMANLVGLTVARNTKAEFDLRRQGVSASPRKMILYGSRETHSSVQKAVELLGLGSEAFRQIRVNKEFQIDLSGVRAGYSRRIREAGIPTVLCYRQRRDRQYWSHRQPGYTCQYL